MKLYHWKNLKNGATGAPWTEAQYQAIKGQGMLSRFSITEEVVQDFGKSFAPPEELKKLMKEKQKS